MAAASQHLSCRRDFGDGTREREREQHISFDFGQIASVIWLEGKTKLLSYIFQNQAEHEGLKL